MDIAADLRKLSRNLYWTWQPEIIDVFRDLDPILWREVNHNPYEFISRLPEEKLQERAANLALDARINCAFHQLRDYTQETNTWGDIHASPLKGRPVAYFSAEFGLHESLPLYSGGLGVLAGDHLKSASDLGIPIVGIGLFYAQGYFNQWLDENGWQQEEYLKSDVDDLPMHRLTDSDGAPLKVQVETRESNINVAVWAADVGRNRLLLLDSNLEENRPEDRQLTANLYGGDQTVRIRQELILGVGGMRTLQALDIKPGVLHLNEGHSAFAVIELANQIMQREKRSFSEVKNRISSRTVFTTHTPVEAGHDRFDPGLVEHNVGPLREQMGLDQHDFLGLGRENPLAREQQYCMTVLGMKMSNYINGVSSIHGRVSREMWQGLWPSRSAADVPIAHITNAVHTPSWLAVPMSRFYQRLLGPDWQDKMCESEMWADIDSMDEEEFWEQQQIIKVQLVNFLHRRLCHKCGDGKRGNLLYDHDELRLDPSILTIGFARRFTEYKRPGLLLQDLDRLDELVNHPEQPIQIVYSGKAHPNDDNGKQLIQRVINATRDRRFRGRIVFVENYDINVARHLVQGVDVWLNCPRRPQEACGTSGQKVILNGGLNLATLDGWWPEGYDGTNGFAIGDGRQHSDPEKQDQYDKEQLYTLLENEVIPLYYSRDENGVPRQWIERQKNAIRSLACKFSSDRMLKDYTLQCYLPAAGAATSARSRTRSFNE